MELSTASEQAQRRPTAREPIHRGSETMTGYFIYLTLCTATASWPILRSTALPWRVEPGRTPRSISIVDAHAVEFSKTAKPHRKGFLLEETDPTQRPEAPAGRPGSIARQAARRPVGVEPKEAGQVARRSLHGAQAAKAPAPDLEHLAVGPRHRHVVLAGRQRALSERDRALVDQAARLGSRTSELSGDQPR